VGFLFVDQQIAKPNLMVRAAGCLNLQCKAEIHATIWLSRVVGVARGSLYPALPKKLQGCSKAYKALLWHLEEARD